MAQSKLRVFTFLQEEALQFEGLKKSGKVLTCFGEVFVIRLRLVLQTLTGQRRCQPVCSATSSAPKLFGIPELVFELAISCCLERF